MASRSDNTPELHAEAVEIVTEVTMGPKRRAGRWSWLVPLLSPLLLPLPSLLLPVAHLSAAGGDVRLVEAVKKADKAALLALLSQHADVNAPEVDGTTALHWAVQRDDLDTAALLIRAGANVKAVNRYGMTALTLACVNGSAAGIEMLLNAGADPNTTLPEGETALMTAARTGARDAVTALLSRGADVNAKENWKGQTALMWAVAERHLAATRALIESGADVRARSRGGMTPLLFAVRAGDIDGVTVLLEAGSDVTDASADGTSALVLAIINARYELAALLLDRGANPNATDPRGSALHALAWMRNPGYPAAPNPRPSGNLDSLELARALLAHGASPNARIAWKENRFDRDGGTVKGPPNIAVGRSFLSYIGATPFWLAAKGADVPLMRLLADNGADPILPTGQGVTPLMAAAGLGFWDGESPGPESGVPERQSLEAVKLACELGNDVNAVTDFGEFPLETAGTDIRFTHPQKLDNAVGDMRWGGSTALHGAALRGANTIVEFLVAKGARLDAKNKLGWTPLTVAEGVFAANTVKAQPSTAALLRQLMGARN
jgi:ankyrin repeat protein